MPDTSPCAVLDPPREEAAVPPAYGRAAAAALILAAAFLPALVDHAGNLWARPHYQFFPVALIGAAILLVQRLRGAGPLTPGALGWAAGLGVAAWALLAVGVVFRSSVLGMVAALVGLAALILAVGGPALFRRLLPAYLYLWVLVPPPLDLDQRFILALQNGTARWSSKVLDAAGVYHVLDGNVVEIPGRRLFVEEACSGIHSFFAVIPLTVFYVLWARRPWVRSVLLVLAAAGWMLAANVARVAGVTLLLTRFGIDVTAGWRHEAFGFAVFAVSLGLLWSTDQLLAFLTDWGTARRPAKGKAKAAPRPAPAETALPDASGRLGELLRRRAAWPALGAFGVLACVSAGLALRQPAPPDLALHFATLGADALPKQVGPWQRQGYELKTREAFSELGHFSQEWDYRSAAHPAMVSLDYPFAGWHELPLCYKAQGWTWMPSDRTVLAGVDGEGAFVELKLSKSLGQYGYLLFGAATADGRPVAPPEHGFWNKVAARLRLDSGRPPATYQVQVFISSPTPLTDADRQQAQELFQQARRHFRPAVSTGGGQ